jgi:hypothetical protein
MQSGTLTLVWTNFHPTGGLHWRMLWGVWSPKQYTHEKVLFFLKKCIIIPLAGTNTCWAQVANPARHPLDRLFSKSLNDPKSLLAHLHNGG